MAPRRRWPAWTGVPARYRRRLDGSGRRAGVRPVGLARPRAGGARRQETQGAHCRLHLEREVIDAERQEVTGGLGGPDRKTGVEDRGPQWRCCGRRRHGSSGSAPGVDRHLQQKVALDAFGAQAVGYECEACGALQAGSRPVDARGMSDIVMTAKGGEGEHAVWRRDRDVDERLVGIFDDVAEAIQCDEEGNHLRGHQHQRTGVHAPRGGAQLPGGVLPRGPHRHGCEEVIAAQECVPHHAARRLPRRLQLPDPACRFGEARRPGLGRGVVSVAAACVAPMRGGRPRGGPGEGVEQQLENGHQRTAQSRAGPSGTRGRSTSGSAVCFVVLANLREQRPQPGHLQPER